MFSSFELSEIKLDARVFSLLDSEMKATGINMVLC